MKNYFLSLRWNRVILLWFAILFLTFFSGRAQAQFFSDNLNEAPDGVVGEPYSFTIVVTDNVNEVPTPFTFSITGGQLPPGLILSASGTISGTPTIGADEFFTVRAESSGGTLITGGRIVIFNLPPCIDSLSPT
ncbi:MAG: Ig domain-containing protein, partial [Acidobacteriota bacterium]